MSGLVGHGFRSRTVSLSLALALGVVAGAVACGEHDADCARARVLESYNTNSSTNST
jgi:hypothetical protein